MTRAVLLTLLPAALALAGPRYVVEFRLKEDPRACLRGWASECDEDGFRFDRFAGGRQVSVRWDEVIDDDVLSLRRRFKLDLSEDEARGLIPAHRLHFKGGGSLEGLLVRIGDDGRYWLQRAGTLFPFPADRVARVEPIKLPEIEVYDTDELYLRRLKQALPRTPRQHRDLADHLFDIGSFAQARKHYEAAIRLRPRWRRELASRLEEITEVSRDAATARTLSRVRSTYRVRKDYDRARALLEEFIARFPARRRAGLQLLDDLEERQRADQERRVHLIKHVEFDRLVDEHVRQRADLTETLSWSTSRLPRDLARRIGERLGLERQQVEELLETRAGGSPHWATYWSGSFIVSRRARRGQTTPKAIRGDPDRWWARYADGGARANFVKAYAAERLPDLFEVVEVRANECTTCGGKGQVRHVSVRQLSAIRGGHEWLQRCPRCFGARVDRSVAYR
ncbi:MAG: hypothetical protein ACYTFD_05375 [Planctomycetota bacterium]|jgi:tetratricopeptide (TPR) repeat protein